MKWQLIEIPAAKLAPWEHNPRTLSLTQEKKLQASLDKFGLIEKPVINVDKTIISGHQRIQILLSQGADTITCWVPDRLLTDEELREINIRLNRHNGDWDWELLGNDYEIGDLLDWGFEDAELVDEPKPKKKPTPAITFEFDDVEHMQRLLPECEKISAVAECKMKVRG